MRKITDVLINRRKELEYLENMINQKMIKAPKGHLRVTYSEGKPRFYYVSELANDKYKYLRKNESNHIRALAQKEYFTKLLKSMERELRWIEDALKRYPEELPEEVYTKLIPARKNLVTPALLDDEEYAKRWQAESYAANPYRPEDKVFATKRGKRVRSKSEAMIADAYYDLGIPYKYDYPIEVPGGRRRYVDFLALDVHRRQVYYHEHLGRLDDPEYLADNMRKIQEYRAMGIYTGKNLILTQEIKNHPLDMHLFRENMKELFGK